MKTTIPGKISWQGESLDKAFAELEEECEQIVRGLTVDVWNRILWRTPQYYGRMVVSYTYSLDFPVFVDRSDLVANLDALDPDERSTQLRSKGDLRAINIANGLNGYMPPRFKLGDTVWIANGVDHGEGPYSGAIEDGKVRLRSINRPGAMVSRTMDYVGSRYASVTKRQAGMLKATTMRGG